MASKNEMTTFGVVSRIDAGGKNYRRGLVTSGFETLGKEHPDFNIVAGGLCDKRTLDASLKELAARLRAKHKKDGLKPAEINRELAGLRSRFIERWAEKLSRAIPVLPSPESKAPITLHIITSPYYDGAIGTEIAMKLAKIRPQDIRCYGEQHQQRFHLRKIDKWLEICVPAKAPWRGKYYARPVMNEVEDSMRGRSLEQYADLYVVGCVGSSIYKPKGGESKRPYFSVPMLSKVPEVKSAENQIGVRLFRVHPDGSIFPRTFNFKDLVAAERLSSRVPKEATKTQEVMVDLLRTRGGQSTGSLCEALKLTPEEVERNIISLVKLDPKKFVFSTTAHRLDFTTRYLQEGLSYPWPDDLARFAVASFACMHASHKNLNHGAIINDLPRVILETGAKVVAGLGDFVCGLAHNLMLQDEVYGGMNESRHERFAAFLVSQAILKVFYDRFLAALEDALRENTVISQERLRALVEEALVWFWYIAGNHCAWVKFAGMVPLEIFRLTAINLITHGIREFLKQHGFYMEGLRKLVTDRFLEGEKQIIPGSKLKVYMCHPSMGRAITISIRPQQVLERAAAQDAHIVLLGNFHVGMALEEWMPGIGQRVAVENGTLLSGTSFEDSKIKDVDQHFSSLTVWAKNDRIYASEAAFYAPSKPEDPLDNERILKDLMERFAVEVPAPVRRNKEGDADKSTSKETNASQDAADEKAG